MGAGSAQNTEAFVEVSFHTVMRTKIPSFQGNTIDMHKGIITCTRMKSSSCIL